MERDDYRHLTAHQLGRQRRQLIVLPFGPAVFDRDVVPLDITGFRQALAEYRRLRHERPGRTRSKKSDDRHRRLLRARRERPGSRCTAAEQDDEFAPSYT